MLESLKMRYRKWKYKKMLLRSYYLRLKNPSEDTTCSLARSIDDINTIFEEFYIKPKEQQP